MEKKGIQYLKSKQLWCAKRVRIFFKKKWILKQCFLKRRQAMDFLAWFDALATAKQKEICIGDISIKEAGFTGELLSNENKNIDKQ